MRALLVFARASARAGRTRCMASRGCPVLHGLGRREGDHRRGVALAVLVGAGPKDGG
ncbi:hypothetical protein [Microtetraspora glauca]|uniref:Uncharacterized protein n=1 Tax=Microtetraspora glauca TaxID=1996 RepID=A0ABV3GL74_MICGL